MGRKNYKHIFFDLDHTLWDFDRNSSEALQEIFEVLKLKFPDMPNFNDFILVYRKVNSELWRQYNQGNISKSFLRLRRFEDTFSEFGIKDNNLNAQIADSYIEKSAGKAHLMDGAIATLEYLSANYSLHIITNGFQEVQQAKIIASGIQCYFKKIIISELVGFLKPDPRIFHHALEITGGIANESLMIGDNLEFDVVGARNAGMDQVYFNPFKTNHTEQVSFEINNLTELVKIL